VLRNMQGRHINSSVELSLASALLLAMVLVAIAVAVMAKRETARSPDEAVRAR